jgi:hypothetical protein
MIIKNNMSVSLRNISCSASAKDKGSKSRASKFMGEIKEDPREVCAKRKRENDKRKEFDSSMSKRMKPLEKNKLDEAYLTVMKAVGDDVVATGQAVKDEWKKFSSVVLPKATGINEEIIKAIDDLMNYWMPVESVFNTTSNPTGHKLGLEATYLMTILVDLLKCSEGDTLK